MLEERPLVTFFIMTYNQARFIAEAIRGAMLQTYSPLEVIVSDDGSTDGTFDVIREEVAKYPGRKVILNRNEQTLGIGAHVSRIMEIASGSFVVASAGDDVSLPQRTEALFAAYVESGGRAFSVFSNATVIDERGKTLGPYFTAPPPGVEGFSAERVSRERASVLGCTHAWDRRVFDLFGPLHRGVVREDNVLTLRSALLGEVRYVPQELVLYRRHGGNVNHTTLADFRDSREFLRSLGTLSLANVRTCQNHLDDLRRARLDGRVDRERAGAIEKNLKVNLRDMKHEHFLFKLGLAGRLRLLTRIAVRGHAPRARMLARWLLWFVFPAPYFRYLKFMNSRGRRVRG